MTIEIINAALSTVTVGALLASALGWRHSLRSAAFDPEWFFAWAKVLMALGIACRLLLWDVVWGLLHSHSREAAIAFSDAIGRTNVNMFFSAIILSGAYFSLKARQLILLQDRGVDWHWTVAWAYPRAKTIMNFVKRERKSGK